MTTRLNRRRFIQTGLAAAAAPAIVPASVFGANAPSNRLTTAVIGTGGMGSVHIEYLPEQAQAQIIAVCDVNQYHLDRGREKAGLKEADAYHDFIEVLERDDIDSVIIATPDHWHCTMSILALRAGKHVYCQKPLSHNIAEGRMLCNAADNSALILQTGAQQRSNPNFRQACELVRNGYIGELKRIRVGLPTGAVSSGYQPVEPVPEWLDFERWLGPAPRQPYHPMRIPAWRHISDTGGGHVTDWGAHHLDIVQWALDMDDSGPVAVEARGAFPTSGIFDVAYQFHIFYTYANGLPVEVADTSRFQQGIEFIGSEGRIFASREKIETTPKSLRRQQMPPGTVRLYQSWHQMVNFFDCIRTGKQPISPAETGHRSATICHIGNIAMQTGGVLRWDAREERFTNSDAANRLLMRPSRAPWKV